MFLQRFFLKREKKRIAIVSLTSCEGCQFAILDLGQKFFDLLRYIDIDEFHLIEDEKETPDFYDIVFVEGNPLTQKNFIRLKEIREKAKTLVVLGNCAALGGVWEIKNYKDKKEVIKYVYKDHSKYIENLDVREIDNFVKVDYTIHGCPINAEEFLYVTNCLIKNKVPNIKQFSVCTECSKRGTKDCFLVKGEICLGTVTLAGCKAVCTKSNQACYGCRGLHKKTNGQILKSLFDNFKKKHTQKEIDHILEFFGLKDNVMEKLKSKK